jgi:hypothetical protein
MKTWTPLLVLVAVTACTATPSPAPSQTTAASGVRCIPLDQVVARRAVSPNEVEFDVLGGTTYRNQLESPCTNLQRIGANAAVAITAGAETGRLCAGDRVKIFDPAEVQATGLAGYPFCKLGQFTALPTR